MPFFFRLHSAHFQGSTFGRKADVLLFNLVKTEKQDGLNEAILLDGRTVWEPVQSNLFPISLLKQRKVNLLCPG